jgi:hypothetical protein
MTIIYLICSSYYRIYMFSFYMSKPSEPIFLTIYTIGAIPTISAMLSFLILSHLVLPHIQHNIPISAHLLYSRVGSQPPILCSIKHRCSNNRLVFSYFNLKDTFVSKKTPEDLIHFNHPTWIQWFTYAFTSSSFCTMNLRFFLLKEWTQDI